MWGFFTKKSENIEEPKQGKRFVSFYDVNGKPVLEILLRLTIPAIPSKGDSIVVDGKKYQVLESHINYDAVDSTEDADLVVVVVKEVYQTSIEYEFPYILKKRCGA
jgi:hypothetical protein